MIVFYETKGLKLKYFFNIDGWLRFPNIVYSCFWLFVFFLNLTNKSQRKSTNKILVVKYFSMEFHLEKNQGILACCCCVYECVSVWSTWRVCSVWFWKGVGMKSLMWIMIHQVAVLVIKNDKNDWLQPTLWSRTR